MNKKINILITVGLISTVIIRLIFAFTKDTSEMVNIYAGKNVEIIGQISDEPLTKDFNKSFTVVVEKIDGKNLDTNIKVTTNRYENYEYGQKLILKGKIQRPANFKSNGNRTFDYINYLLKDDIYFIIKNPEIIVIDNGNSFSIRSILFKIKRGFIRNLEKTLGEPHSALAGGLVVGEKSALGKDLIEDFRKAGLIHIVVLSGYNITIVADSIRRMLSFLPRNLGIILGAVGIIVFGILVGGGATVIRSCLMATIALLSEFLRKDYNVGRALFIAGAIMLIQNPMILLYDPSFQLSFLATVGLLLLSSPIEKKLGFITEKFGIRGLVASTLATQIFVSPYILYMMGQLSIIGLIVNILVLPIIPITMLLVTMTGLLGFISESLSLITAWLSHFLLSYELFMVRFFADLPFSSINLPKFSFWIVIGFYASYLIIFTNLSSTFAQFRFWKKSST